MRYRNYFPLMLALMLAVAGGTASVAAQENNNGEGRKEKKEDRRDDIRREVEDLIRTMTDASPSPTPPMPPASPVPIVSPTSSPTPSPTPTPSPAAASSTVIFTGTTAPAVYENLPKTPVRPEGAPSNLTAAVQDFFTLDYEGTSPNYYEHGGLDERTTRSLKILGLTSGFAGLLMLAGKAVLAALH